MKNKNIKLVVFDMAGTTINEDNLVYKALHKVFVKMGYTVTLDYVLQHCAGKEKLNAIVELLNDLNYPTTQADAIFEEFSKTLKSVYEESEVKPITGVGTFLTKLKAANIKVVLNTGYNSYTANQLLDKLNWKKGIHFDALITADDVSKGRPHPDMILKAMDEFDIDDSQNVLKAGDSVVDIEEGKNANCGLTVGVLSGAQTREELQKANPDLIVTTITELDFLFAQPVIR
ncbi:phosphonatase-like hydrolase [Flavobacterium sp.]|uniref:phosphonatase-like hydrolase n=1 Tax=Flavobacterium sp. TaxID=239 RepID=UPI003D6A57E9